MSVMNLTPHHAKYYAHDLTRRAMSGIDRLSTALFDAAVDLNPHQIEAALFALESPLSNGVILADEVGLGKTIEAGIVLCQYWAERRRRLLVICPASIRKQWALELQEKFSLPTVVLDARAYQEARREARDPLRPDAVLIVSLHYANALRDALRSVKWDLVVIDEAHKLRNAYRPSNKVGQGIRWATEGCRKILLTATPLQNSLLELYGLSTLIDERLFGDVNAFRSRYAVAGGDLADLRARLATFCKRTLRKQVTEYIRYTERRPITRPFRPTDTEQALYEQVSAFLQQEDTYALPRRQRHMTTLILRKLLASSPAAIAATLDLLRHRLETLRDRPEANREDLAERLITEEDIESDLLDEILTDNEDADETLPKNAPIDRRQLDGEIEELRRLADQARRIGVDTKSRTLLKALEIGFEQMKPIGAARKAVIFTESRRTQDYLKGFLDAHGYAGQVVLFNGSNGGPEAAAIYERWVARNADTGRVSGSRAVDLRTALIEHFRDHATILLATEAGAEGINLQFCSLVINYDLPWNPQRIEQRIGRCHRYGQKHDVVVINFLNERNHADRRVLELLTEKFNLFSGVFGASDEVLGSIESGVDFEQRILAIYQQCRTPEEIDAAFHALQSELDEQIRRRLDDARRVLFEHFDEDVHQRLRLRLADARAQLDRVGRRFWSLTRHVLADRARFDEAALAFDLDRPPREDIPRGRYHLISKSRPSADDDGVEEPSRFLYRLSHPLGEYVLDTAKAADTPAAEIHFDVTNHPARLSVVEALRGRRGYLTLTRLMIESYEREEYLLFSGFTDDLPAPRPGIYFVYVLECDDRSLYIGQTENLPRRWQEHIEGQAAEWTKRHKPVRIAHYEEFGSRQEAVKRESDLKTGFGRKWLKDAIASGRARQAGGAALDQETMEKLFWCSGRVVGSAPVPELCARRLAAESERHAQATVSRSLERNSRHFQEAREKLERWADDMVLSAEKALADTKEQIKALRRQAHQAVTLEEQHQILEKIQQLERRQRRQRQEIFKVEDEIMEKRDQLIDHLEKRLAQRTAIETLFTIRWEVI